MMRTLHSALGLVAAMLIVVMALSGAMLSIDAVRDRFAAPSSVSAELTVAELAEAALRAAPGVERIERKASGAFVMTAFDQIARHWPSSIRQPARCLPLQNRPHSCWR